MIWQKPELLEVNMSAEIGAYQEDFDERDDAPPFVVPVAPAEAAAPQSA